MNKILKIFKGNFLFVQNQKNGLCRATQSFSLGVTNIKREEEVSFFDGSHIKSCNTVTHHNLHVIFNKII